MSSDLLEIAKKIKSWYDTIPTLYGPIRRQKRFDSAPDDIKKLVHSLYYDHELGNPTQARLAGIPKTCYSKILKACEIQRRPNSFTSQRVRKLRADKIKGENNPRVYSDKNQYSTGVKGRYLSKKGESVYLRSCWEFIYAKWLDKHNIEWKYEDKQYRLLCGKFYRPDFFIFENTVLKYVVEIKGANKEALYKAKLLSDEYNIKVILIDDITPYCESNYTIELKKWKQLQELKK